MWWKKEAIGGTNGASDGWGVSAGQSHWKLVLGNKGSIRYQQTQLGRVGMVHHKLGTLLTDRRCTILAPFGGACSVQHVNDRDSRDMTSMERVGGQAGQHHPLVKSRRQPSASIIVGVAIPLSAERKAAWATSKEQRYLSVLGHFLSLVLTASPK